MYTLRPYQKQASDAALRAFQSGRGKSGLLVLPTGAGKSLVIADIAYKLGEPLLVFQPSKEILEQNYAKLCSYGFMDCSIYSASVGQKVISKVTFCTIGTAFNQMEAFRKYKYIIWDEAHDKVNPKGGQAEKFIHDNPERVVIGLTATPYRLHTFRSGSMLKFLTRTRPRIFSEVFYYCQISDLLAKGFLANLNYYDVTKINMLNVRSNSTGNDFDDESLVMEYERSGFYDQLIATVDRLRHPKRGGKRKGILVFTKFVREAQMVADHFPNCAIVSGETPKKEREKILEAFNAGRIEVVANAQTLTTGFDYPELDTILLARPTKSLSLYYQMVGRAIRPHKEKGAGWIVDMCGNYQRFGKVEDLRIECPVNTERWMITSNGRQITNVMM